MIFTRCTVHKLNSEEQLQGRLNYFHIPGVCIECQADMWYFLIPGACTECQTDMWYYYTQFVMVMYVVAAVMMVKEASIST